MTDKALTDEKIRLDSCEGTGGDLSHLASSPIGVFDSGLGGLTVLKEIQKVLPHESTIYFGDNGRAPYGTKSRDTIVHFARQDAQFLLSKNVKMIVIACNTVSSFAYETLRDINHVPVVEVITPGALAALKHTRNGKIGIIGTTATVKSGIYEQTILELASNQANNQADKKDIQVYSQACPLFVSLAEEGWWEDEITYLTAKKYLAPLKELGADTIVLGCTHYPLLKKVISRTMGPDVAIVDSALEVASKVARLLDSCQLANTDTSQPAKHEYFTSDSEEKFMALGSAFLDKKIKDAKKVDIEQF